MRVSTIPVILGLSAVSSAQLKVTKNTLERACNNYDYNLWCCDNPYYPSQPFSVQRRFYNCTITDTTTGINACTLKKECKRVPVCADYSEIGGEMEFQTGWFLKSVLHQIGHSDWANCYEKDDA